MRKQDSKKKNKQNTYKQRKNTIQRNIADKQQRKKKNKTTKIRRHRKQAENHRIFKETEKKEMRNYRYCYYV